MMPNMDGLSLCRTIRQQANPKSRTVPIVFLSSKSEEIDKVLGLELGGDDYLTKPFSTRELVSRVKAVLRRSQALTPSASAAESERRAGGVTLDLEGHRAWVGAAEIPLTGTEFRIMEVLLRRPGRLYTRDELLERAYEQGHHVSARTLDSHVRRIRAKLSAAGVTPIETVHGLGYRLRPS
jgi:two-component system OmpR family response regulator